MDLRQREVPIHSWNRRGIPATMPKVTKITCELCGRDVTHRYTVVDVGGEHYSAEQATYFCRAAGRDCMKLYFYGGTLEEKEECLKT